MFCRTIWQSESERESRVWIDMAISIQLASRLRSLKYRCPGLGIGGTSSKFPAVWLCLFGWMLLLATSVSFSAISTPKTWKPCLWKKLRAPPSPQPKSNILSPPPSIYFEIMSEIPTIKAENETFNIRSYISVRSIFLILRIFTHRANPCCRKKTMWWLNRCNLSFLLLSPGRLASIFPIDKNQLY